MDIDESGANDPGTAAPVSTTTEPTTPEPTTAEPTTPEPTTPEPVITPTRRAGRPASITAIAAILLAGGGAIEGYAIALTGDSVGRQYSVVWALLGATLVLTAWALRGRRWWGAAAAIAVSSVGLFAGMYGVYGILILTNASTDDGANWGTTVGLIAVGAASIAILGLLSSAWTWLAAPSPPGRSGPVSSQPA